LTHRVGTKGQGTARGTKQQEATTSNNKQQQQHQGEEKTAKTCE